MKISGFYKSFIYLFLAFTVISSAVFGQVNHLVISQVYGGGGNSGASYRNDFIELFNPTGSSVSLTGWSVQYASTSGSTWGSRTNLSGSIAPGGYFLISGASGGAVGSALPTADVTGSIDLAGANGKVALVSTTVALSGSCPSAVDFVGYGSANCYEGSGAAGAASVTSSAKRTASCTDDDDNSSDFTVGTVTPRNSATSPLYCYPTKFVVTSITPNPPTAGIGFTVIVVAQNAGNVNQNVIANTGFSLTTNGTAGIIGGATTGIIAAGTYSVTVTGVTLASSGTAATITATRTSGDGLAAGTSATFNVNPLSPCAGTPTGGSLSPGISNFCNSGSTTYSLTGGSTATGLTYQWSSNASNTPPGSNISGATNNTYTTGTQSSTTYYWCTTTCTVSTLSAISSVGVLSVTPNPTVSVSPPSGNIGTSLTASGATTYSWAPSSSLSASTGATVVASPTVTTTYTVTGTGSGGCISTATATVTNLCDGTPSGGTMSPGVTNRCGSGTASLSLSGGSPGVGFTYQWSSNSSNTPPGTNISGATNSTYTTATATSTTYYWCTTTCSTSSLSAISPVGVLSVTPTPTVTVTPPSGNIGTSLTASGATTYSWAPSAGLSASTGATVVASPTVTTTYTVTGTGTGGCISTATATVTNLCDGTPSGGTVSPASSIICGSGSTPLSVTGGSPGVGITYQWSSNSTNTPPGANISGATNSAYTPSSVSSTTYYWRTSTCTTSSLSAISSVGVLSVTPSPTVTVTPPSGNVGVSLTASGAASYAWSPAAGLSASTGATVTASPTVTTTYTVTGTGSGGCTSTSTVTVTNPSGVVIWNFTAGTFTPFSSTVASVPTNSCTATYNSTATCSNCGITSTAASSGYTGSSGTNNVGINDDGGAFNAGTSAYISFTLTPNSGYCLKITGVSFGERSTSSGTTNYRIRTSVDGFASDKATGTFLTNSNWILYNPTFTSVSASGAIEVRIYGHGGSGGSTSANWRFDDVTFSVTSDLLPGAIGGLSAVCSGGNTVVTNSVSGGTWSSSNTGVATIGTATGALTAVVSGTTVITYTTPTGCYATKNFTVNPNPVAIVGTTSVCSQSTATLTNGTGGGTWSSSATGLATIGSATGIATGVSAGTSVITYRISSTGCYSTSVFTVNPLPATITGSDICVGSTTTYSNGTGGGTWSSSATGVATIGSATGIATGVSAGTSVITYQLSSTGCYTTTVVTVNPLPTSIMGSDICPGTTAAFTNATGGGTWSSSATGVATIGSATGIATGVSTGTSVITYQLSSTGCYTTTVIAVNPLPASITGIDFCVGSTTTYSNGTGGGTWSTSATGVATIGSATGIATGVSAGTTVITYQLSVTGCYTTTVVTINPLPASISGTNICDGATTTYANVTGGGTWSSSATGVASVGSSTGIVSGVITGSAIITYTIPSGCFATKAVTVNPLPASITGTTAVCPLLTTTLANVSGGGTWSSSATGIATVGSGTGTVTGVAAGTSTITYSLTTGCIATMVVTVIPNPAAITGIASACVGFTSTLSSATPSGNWSSSAVGVATVGTLSGVITAVSAGTATITYMRSNGCYATATFTTHPLPAAIGGTGTVCAGFTITYTNATAGGTWSSSATGVATVGSATGVVSGVAAGSATITYTLGTGCRATGGVTVSAAPAAIGGTAKACVGFSSTLSNTTGGGTWSSSDAGIASVGSTTGVTTGVSAGTATITYTRSNGCFATKVYTVNANPAAIGGTTAICVGQTSTLTNATGGGAWTSTAPSFAPVGVATGIVTGAAATPATITYTLSNGCYATTGFTVNANPSTIGGTRYACEGFSTTLTNTTGGGAWSSSDAGIASIGTTGITTGVSAGTATITYTRSNGCYAITTYSVNASPAAITGTLRACIGFTSTLSSAIGGGTWTSTAPAIASVGAGTGVVSALVAGNTNITYTLSNGCRATDNYTVNANPANIGGTTNVCTGGTATLTNATGGGAWSVSNANATMGTGSGVVTGVTAGTAVVSYTLSTGCYKTTNINIYESPAAISGTGSICAGGTTTLSNSVSGGVWSSSNTAVATVGSVDGIVTGVAGGTANITYNIGGTCFTTFTTTIGAILPITGTPSACTGSSSLLRCSSAGGTWSSSDAVVATIGSTTGIMTGVSVGTSVITYALPSGCARYLTVYISDPGSSISGASSVCVGQNITLTNTTAPGGAWTSSNGGIALVGLYTGVVTGRVASTATITYTLGTSCYITKSVTINTFSPNYASVTNVMVGNTITVGNAMAGGTWSSSATGVATVNSTTGVVTGVSAGTVSISYTVASGCTDVTNVTVNAAPAVITGPATVCVGQSVTLSSTTPGGVWTSANGGIASVGSSTGIVSGRIAAAVNITYSVGGGYSVRTVTVTAFTPSYTSVYTLMSGNSLTMVNPTAGGTWSSTNTGAATVNSTSGLVTGVGAGTTTISYTLPSGCADGNMLTVTAAPSAIGGPSVVCFSQTATLTSATPGGVWSSSNGGVASVGSLTGIVTPVFASTVNITYTVGSGYAVKTMTVANFSAVYASVTTINSGSTTTIFNTTPGGVWSSSASTIATVNSTTGVVTGVLTGTAMISYTMPTGCADGIMVTVSPAPAIGSGPGTVCVGNTLTLTHATPGGVWTSSNGGVALVGSSTGIVTGRIANTCTITYTLPSSVYVTTTITVLPLATITGQTKICQSQSLTLTNSIAGGTWFSSNGGVASAGSATGVITGVSMGTSIISYILPTGCYALKTVTVVANMTAITGTPNVCEGSSVTLGNAITGGAWSSSSTGVATVVLFGGSVTGVSAGTSTITYTVGPGCKAYTAFTVNAVPAAISGGNSVCVSTPITLTSGTGGGEWTSLDPSIATVGSADGLVTGITPGFSTTITYTLPATGCYAVNTMAVNPCRFAGDEDLTKAATFTLIPNPNNGAFMLKGNYVTHAGEEAISIEVMNTLGQIVYKNIIKAINGRIEEQIQLTGTLANGMYLLNLHTPAENKVFHFVISK